MEKLFALTDAVFPVPVRFRSRLNRDVAELSRLLTSARGERGASYLGQSAMLTAYLRCFLPWNVYRLVRLLPPLPLALSDGDVISDLGSGPLTLPIALWIARPELRPLKLVFHCVDRTQAVLEAGKKLFAALASPDGVEKARGDGTARTKDGASYAVPGTAWTIKTIRGDILHYGRRGGRGTGGKAGLVCAVNVYNELFWDIPHSDSRTLARFAEQEARRLTEIVTDGASILVVEPGVPRSGEFIVFLRDALAAFGRPVVSPCTHGGSCPFPGGRGGRGGEKRKWCHFSFDADGAPKKLLTLSASAGIPKEKAVLSFLFAGGVSGHAAGAPVGAEIVDAPTDVKGIGASDERRIAVRVLSGKFPVTEKSAPVSRASGTLFGRYGCCALGAVLLTGAGCEMDAVPPGTLLHCDPPICEKRDSKSGAFILNQFQFMQGEHP
ncbi:MAG: rRNA methyltransferase [Spirochaetaceae bacterium]|nr:rRNA methyltransferase [Spirochaetaceae bacterium]